MQRLSAAPRLLILVPRWLLRQSRLAQETARLFDPRTEYVARIGGGKPIFACSNLFDGGH
jgi:hypothetical protein